MVDILQCRQDMKQCVQEQPEAVSMVVYHEKLLQVSPDVVPLIPNKETVSRSLHQEHAKLCPRLPATANDLELAPYQMVTNDNERFLLLDVVHDGDRVLVFGSDFFINLLCAAPDGTFRTVPCIFMQLFTVNFMYNDKLLPAVYILAKWKTQSLYEFLLREIQRCAEERGLQLQPAHFLTDFEARLMCAITVQLPNTQQRGCFFHFCQCCYRHIQSLGLQQLYRTNNAHRILLQVCMSLTFCQILKLV